MMGAILVCTDALRDALQDAACDEALPQNVRQDAEDLIREGSKEVPWLQLKEILRRPHRRHGWLHELCAGSDLVLRPPKARTRSPELQARLAALQKQLEQQQYDAMVHDVTQAERAAAAASEGGLVTYKAQLSVGLHILVMMGTFYAAGHVGTSYFSDSVVHSMVGGLVGLILAMVTETLLLIIRSSSPQQLPVEKALRRSRSRPGKPPAVADMQGSAVSREKKCS